jgi:hypothetical protein
VGKFILFLLGGFIVLLGMVIVTGRSEGLCGAWLGSYPYPLKYNGSALEIFNAPLLMNGPFDGKERTPPRVAYGDYILSEYKDQVALSLYPPVIYKFIGKERHVYDVLTEQDKYQEQMYWSEISVWQDGVERRGYVPFDASEGTAYTVNKLYSTNAPFVNLDSEESIRRALAADYIDLEQPLTGSKVAPDSFAAIFDLDVSKIGGNRYYARWDDKCRLSLVERE